MSFSKCVLFSGKGSQYCIHNSQINREQNVSALPPVTLWALKAVHLHLAVQPQCLHSHSLTIQQIQQFMIKEHKGFQAEIGTALLSLGCCCMRTQELISKVPAEREIISGPAKTALLYPQVPLSSSALWKLGTFMLSVPVGTRFTTRGLREKLLRTKF